MGTKRFLTKIRSAALLVAVLVFAVANTGSIVFAATAPADPTTPKTTPKTAAELAPINERAISWQVLRLLVEGQCRFADKIKTADALNGDFNNGGGASDVSVGHIIGPEKGVMPCKDALVKGVNLWANGDTVGFFEKIGYVQNGDTLEAKTYSVSSLTAAIPARFFFTTNRDAADYALLYYIFRQDFIAGCRATLFKEVSQATPDEVKSATTADDVYRIKDVQPDGTVKDMLYKAEMGKGDVISVGYGIGTTNGGKADCAEIAGKLNDNNLVQGYSAILGIDSSAAPALAQSGATTPNSNDGCYSLISVFGWIMCPMLDLADGIFGFLKSSIYSLLAIPEVTASSGNGLKASWNAVKNIANATLILVALVMIGSQIFNFSFVDAYTVKKVLPRLVIATILIQLSWFIFTALLELFNALGYSINTLVTAPFQAAGGGDIIDILGNQGAGNTNVAGIFATLGAGIGVVAAATALSSGGFLTLAMVAIGVIVSIVLVVLTLVVRKLLLFVLLVTAPIALVAWILPGTQKYWTTWWNLFIKLLMMFPLIALLFAAGQIFATVAANSPTSNAAAGGVNVIIIIIAYFAPLFLIPATFKFAGGIFGSIVGGINNFGDRAKKSGFGLREQRDAIRKYDGEARARAYTERARERRQNLLQDDSRMSKARARMGMGIVGLGKYGTKVIEEEKTAGANRIDAEKLKTASEALNTQFKGTTFDYPQQKELAKAVAAGATSYDYNGQSYKTGIEPSEYSTRAAAGWLAQNKDVDAVRQTLDNLYSKGDPASAQLAEQIKNENVGSLMGIAADLYGKGPADLGHAELAGQKSTTLRNFRAQLADWEKQAQNHRANGEDAKAEALEKKILTTQEQAEKALHASSTGTLSIPPENQVELERILNAQFETQTQQGEKILDYAGRDQSDPSFGVKHRYNPVAGSSNSTNGNLY